MVVDKLMDRSQGYARSALEIKSLLQEENLHDIWRCQHSNERDYTSFTTSKATHSGIDMILIDVSTLMSATIEYTV